MKLIKNNDFKIAVVSFATAGILLGANIFSTIPEVTGYLFEGYGVDNIEKIDDTYYIDVKIDTVDKEYQFSKDDLKNMELISNKRNSIELSEDTYMSVMPISDTTNKNLINLAIFVSTVSGIVASVNTYISKKEKVKSF